MLSFFWYVICVLYYQSYRISQVKCEIELNSIRVENVEIEIIIIIINMYYCIHFKCNKTINESVTKSFNKSQKQKILYGGSCIRMFLNRYLFDMSCNKFPGQWLKVFSMLIICHFVLIPCSSKVNLIPYKNNRKNFSLSMDFYKHHLNIIILLFYIGTNKIYK